MVNKINNKGFTLLELLATIIVSGIILAASIGIYGAAMKNAEMTGAINGVQNIQTIAGYYAQENGNFNGLNGQILQADKLMPSGWTYGGTNDNRLIPVSTAFVSYYWLGPEIGNTLGFTAGNYIVGIDIPTLTDAQAQVLCNSFSGQLQQYAFGGTVYSLPCHIAINSTLFNNVLYFTF
jgi:prepilin-type N-terminal cleavage/methylation domain-containing protein